MKQAIPFLVAKGCSVVQNLGCFTSILWAIIKKCQMVKNVINQSIGEAAEGSEMGFGFGVKEFGFSMGLARIWI